MAELVEIRDEEGNFVKYKKYDGRYYFLHFVGNVKDHLAAIELMDVRDDDTFILTYPKSGTHWTFNIVSMLRTGETVYSGSPTFLDLNDKDTLDKLPSPRVFASHLTFDFMPKQLKEGKGKVVAIFRNPKDMLTSFFEFSDKIVGKIRETYDVTWKGFLNFHYEGKNLKYTCFLSCSDQHMVISVTAMYGSWFDYIQSWDKVRKEHTRPNIMYLMYEDMKQDLSLHVHKLASFLGVTFGSDFLDKVTARCTFSNMAEEATRTFTPSEQFKDVTSDKTLPIYRKGVVGDWKNHFTVAQSEHFDKVYNNKMKVSTFEFRFV